LLINIRQSINNTLVFFILLKPLIYTNLLMKIVLVSLQNFSKLIEETLNKEYLFIEDFMEQSQKLWDFKNV